MPDVPSTLPMGEGANASIAYGQSRQSTQQDKALAGPGGPSGPAAGGPPGPAPGAPAPPVQPQAPQPQGRLDMGQVFPPMPQMQMVDKEPWRQVIRNHMTTLADHPQAGDAWQRVVDLIKDQRGPMGH